MHRQNLSFNPIVQHPFLLETSATHLARVLGRSPWRRAYRFKVNYGSCKIKSIDQLAQNHIISYSRWKLPTHTHTRTIHLFRTYIGELFFAHPLIHNVPLFVRSPGLIPMWWNCPQSSALRRGLDRATITEKRPYAQIDDVPGMNGELYIYIYIFSIIYIYIY